MKYSRYSRETPQAYLPAHCLFVVGEQAVDSNAPSLHSAAHSLKYENIHIGNCKIRFNHPPY